MAGYKAVLITCIIIISGRRTFLTGDHCNSEIINWNIVADAIRSVVVHAEEAAKCECGLFKFPTAETTKESPLVSKTPQFNFECDADGKQSCSNMCKALAGASREEGPKRICDLIEDSDTAFVPVIYYKACNDDAWSYTGFKSTLEVCCKAKEVVPCA